MKISIRRKSKGLGICNQSKTKKCGAVLQTFLRSVLACQEERLLWSALYLHLIVRSNTEYLKISSIKHLSKTG